MFGHYTQSYRGRYEGYEEGLTTDFYDIAKDTWTKGPVMTNPEVMMSTCILGGILYAFSG